MSRHRNVRSMNYSDEYDGYDDVYGHSVEDDSCISPSDAAFMYDRNNRQTQISAFITEEDDIEEVDEDTEPEVGRRHSDSFRYPQLSDVDEARLRSCLDEIHSVIGDSIPENIVVETVLEKNFDLAQALDALLKSSQNKQDEPKLQRERNRRSRPVEKDDNYFNRNLPVYRVKAIVENNRNLKLAPSLSGRRTVKYKKEVPSPAKNSFTVTNSSSNFFNASNFAHVEDFLCNSDSHRIEHKTNNTNLKRMLNSVNLKMDSLTDSEPEKALSLGAKYNKPQHSFNSFLYDASKTNGDIGIEVASKYIGKRPDFYNPQGPAKSVNYSSDDSDTEFSSMSLVALAAKHKSNTPLFSEEKSVLVSSKTDLLALEKNRFIDSSDSSSETEDTSLFALMRKNKVKEGYVVDGCINIKDESQQSGNSLNINQCPVEDSTDFKYAKLRKDLDIQTQNLRVEEITTKFVAAHFSDDSDSEEPLSLMGLALKHAKSVNHEGSGSADDVQYSKPNIKELQNLANYHRQHTKSESDRFSSSAVHPSDSLLKKSLEINVSTSLRSLRGGGHQDMGLKFSPGGSIPGSFKSLNTSNSLNSSLPSVGVESDSKWLGSCTDISNACSDSDVSIGSRHFDNKFGKWQDPGVVKNILPLDGEKRSEHFSVDVVDGGINLSCALKKSTIERTSESLTSENSVDFLADAADEEIVTLLDSLMVDEEAVEEVKDKKRLRSNSELDESCTIDISHILKVRVKLRTRRCSSFGKVVCRQWRSLRTPYIREDKQKTSVIPFNFVEPSPDDVIANAFKRRL